MSTVPFNRQRQAPLPSDIAKKLPSNLDAERSILGAILLDNSAVKEVIGYLHNNDFSLAQHQVIFEAMWQMCREQASGGKELDHFIDLVTLSDHLTSSGKIDAAGGIVYISSLADGLPKVTNLRHYAKIIRDKAALRALIHTSHNIQQRAFENDDVEEILATAQHQIENFKSHSDENPAVVVGFQELLTRECAPIEYAIDPLLSRRGTGEIYGWRGTGKSFISTDMAVSIATGAQSIWGGHKGGGGHWAISRPFRQLYVYGEMDESEIQERVRTIARMHGSDVPTDEQFGTICMDYQKNWRPKLSTARDRKFIEDRVFGGGYEGLWLDNLSTLWPASQEKQGDRDADLADWFTDLNQRGVWVIFLHHAGKSGEQRGGSEKEDMLSFVLKLRRPANYKPSEQLRVEVHIEKNRHKCLSPKMLMPFEVQLTKNALGQPEWLTRPAQAAQRAAAFEMFKNKMPTMLVGQEVGVSRATVYRWYKDFTENQNPDFHLESESD